MTFINSHIHELHKLHLASHYIVTTCLFSLPFPGCLTSTISRCMINVISKFLMLTFTMDVFGISSYKEMEQTLIVKKIVKASHPFRFMILAILHIYLYLNLSLQVTQTSFNSIHIGLKSSLHAFFEIFTFKIINLSY